MRLMKWIPEQSISTKILFFALMFLLFLLFTHSYWEWRVIEGVATAILALGVLAAFDQVRLARKGTNAQVAVQLFQRLREGDARETLSKLYDKTPQELKELLTIKSSTEYEKDSLRDRIENVIDNIELIGALVEQGIIDKRVAVEAYSGSTVVRLWYKLHQYIREETKLRGGLYCKNLDNFAFLSWQHQKKLKVGEHTHFYKRNQSEPPLDLIEEFNKHQDLQPEKRA